MWDRQSDSFFYCTGSFHIWSQAWCELFKSVHQLERRSRTSKEWDFVSLRGPFVNLGVINNIIWINLKKTTCLCTILDLEKSISKQSAMFCRAANWASSSDRREENQTVGGVDEALWRPTIWVFMAWQISDTDGSSTSCGVILPGSLSWSMWLSDGDSSGISRVHRITFHQRCSASPLIWLYSVWIHSCTRPSI